MLSPAIARPAPEYLWLLLLLVPGIWFLAKFLLSKRGEPSSAEALQVTGLSLSIFLLSTHVFALLSSNFYTGLFLGCVVPAAIGSFLRVRHKFSQCELVPGRDLLVAFVCLVPILPAVVFWDFHDSRGAHYSTHLSIVEQILNGIYPPRDLAFAEYALGYHYGIDTLFASVAAVLGASVDMAINLVTLLLWAYSALLLAKIGRKMFEKSGAILFPLIGCFSGGFPWLIGNAKSETWALLGLYEVNGSFLNPPIASYFFQYPWTIGIPLALLSFDLILSRRAPLFPVSLYVLTIGISNTTLLLTLSATLVAYFLHSAFWADQGNKRRNYLLSLVVLVSACAALALSGFSSVLTKSSSHLVLSLDGIANGFTESLIWNLATFGPMLLLGVLGLFFAGRLKVVLALLIFGSLGVVNIVEYKHSWDIVKFATVAQFALALAAASFICVSLKKAKILSVLLAALIIAPGVAFHSTFWRSDEANKDNPMAKALWRSDIVTNLSANQRDALVWLRREIKAGDVVVVPQKWALSYAHLGGMPQIWITAVTRALGFPEQDLARRDSIMREFPETVEPYVTEGVRWFVFDKNEESPVARLSQKLLKEGSLKERVNFGNVVIASFVSGETNSL